jgi:hypothetical protein
LSIIELLIILKKIDDFATEMEAKVMADRENPNQEDEGNAKKAREFQLQVVEIGELEFPIIREFMSTFNQLILEIEIRCENGTAEKLQHIYFAYHPVFEYLASTTKDRIMAEVKRGTPRDKLISLLGFREEIYD